MNFCLHLPFKNLKTLFQKFQIQLPSIEKKIDGKTNGIIHSKMLISDG